MVSKLLTFLPSTPRDDGPTGWVRESISTPSISYFDPLRRGAGYGCVKAFGACFPARLAIIFHALNSWRAGCGCVKVHAGKLWEPLLLHSCCCTVLNRPKQNRLLLLQAFEPSKSKLPGASNAGFYLRKQCNRVMLLTVDELPQCITMVISGFRLESPDNQISAKLWS